jgi:hypothetical protein
MDNRINQLRRKISALRLNMLDMAASIRDQVNNDRDCTESSLRLMGMRQELAALVREWMLLGGGERLPTIQERLRENYRPVRKPKAPAKQKPGGAPPRCAKVSVSKPVARCAHNDGTSNLDHSLHGPTASVLQKAITFPALLAWTPMASLFSGALGANGVYFRNSTTHRRRGNASL